MRLIFLFILSCFLFVSCKSVEPQKPIIPAQIKVEEPVKQKEYFLIKTKNGIMNFILCEDGKCRLTPDKVIVFKSLDDAKKYVESSLSELKKIKPNFDFKADSDYLIEYDLNLLIEIVENNQAIADELQRRKDKFFEKDVI